MKSLTLTAQSSQSGGQRQTPKESVDTQWTSDHELRVCRRRRETDYSPMVSLRYNQTLQHRKTAEARKQPPLTAPQPNQVAHSLQTEFTSGGMGVSKISSHSLKEKDKTRSTDLSKSSAISAFVTKLVCPIRKIDVLQPVLVQTVSEDRVEIDQVPIMFWLKKTNTFHNEASDNKEQGVSSNLYISASQNES